MRTIPILCTLLITVLAGCDQGPPAALAPDGAPSAHAAPNPMIPFRSSLYDFQITSRVAGGCGQSGDLVQLVGDGTATHVGHFIVSFSFCTVAGASTLTNGQGHFVAANDDRLQFTFHGVSTFTPPATVTFTSFITFSGGTGRFRHATGSAEVTGTVDAVTGAGSGHWEGTIDR